MSPLADTSSLVHTHVRTYVHTPPHSAYSFLKSFAAVVHVPGGVGGGHLSKVKGIHRPIGVPYHHETTPVGGGEGRREMGKEGGKQRGEGKGGGHGRVESVYSVYICTF